KELKKINYIRDPKNLKAILNILSPSKMEILKLCDGTRTIRDIVDKSPMKESSTRSYLSRLKAQNIITGDPKPKRKVDEVLISFN
ncbi:MAG: hypothetical protein KJ574_04335, partial [Nanoarchaeota archaeon]|nr:hypothetical protein [Nanoarchaeota archaeon]